MSGVLGLWNRDGQPIDQQLLKNMSSALKHRGPDGEVIKSWGAVGFACQQNWVTPRRESQLFSLLDEFHISFDGRIDNREELLSLLANTSLVSSMSSDQALVLAAYIKWDKDFVHHLKGDFAFAIYDSGKQEIYLCRDVMGIRPIYYYATDKIFLFASEIKALLKHPLVESSYSEVGLSDYMMLRGKPFDGQERTCFENIYSLVPAHTLRVTKEKTSVQRYWDFDPHKKIKRKKFEDYVEEFQSIFNLAVQRRARSANPVAVSLSGGLDSSSIFGSAETQRRQNKVIAPKIFGVSYVAEKGTDSDEHEFLEKVENMYNMSSEKIPMEPLLGIVKSAEKEIYHLEAPFLEYMWDITREVYGRAQKNNAKVVLSGHWGDQMMFSTDYLIDSFYQLKWGRVYKHLKSYANWYSPGEVDFYRKNFLYETAKSVIPEQMIPAIRKIKRVFFPLKYQIQAFSDRFYDVSRLQYENNYSFHKNFKDRHAKYIYYQARSKYHIMCMEWNNKSAASYGLEYAFPFLDPELVQFMMSVPATAFCHKGIPRTLLRESMRSVLPEGLADRSWKADFTEMVNTSVRQDFTHISKVLKQDPRVVQEGFVDKANLQKLLQSADKNLPAANCEFAWDLVDVYGFELWLKEFFSTTKKIKKKTHHEDIRI